MRWSSNLRQAAQSKCADSINEIASFAPLVNSDGNVTISTGQPIRDLSCSSGVVRGTVNGFNGRYTWGLTVKLDGIVADTILLKAVHSGESFSSATNLRFSQCVVDPTFALPVSS